VSGADGAGRSPFSIGVIVLGGGAVLGALFLIVGWLLPTDFEATAERVVDVPPEAVFRYLDSPEGWRDWTSWPESGLERSGPSRGEGARLAWDDPELGVGSFTLVAVAPTERVQYRVEVGGSMLTEGDVTLADDAGRVRIRWRERGSLGRNPLMGWWALSMERAQSDELVKGLERLEAVAKEGLALAAPSDSASAGDAHQH
jgi:uncharacterized protein YndB with AHSA1/START domain